MRREVVRQLSFGRHVGTTLDALEQQLGVLRVELGAISGRMGPGDAAKRSEVKAIYRDAVLILARHSCERAFEILKDEMQRFASAEDNLSNVGAYFSVPLAEGLVLLGTRDAVKLVVRQVGVKHVVPPLQVLAEQLNRPAPTSSPPTLREWDAWFEEIESELPVRLGKCTDPLPPPP